MTNWINKQSFIKKIFGNLLFRLIVTIVLCWLFHDHLGINTIRFFLTLSVLLREILMSVLPFLVFSFVAVALLEFRSNGAFFVLLLMIVIFVSNFFHVLLAGVMGFSLLGAVKINQMVSCQEVTPFFQLRLFNITSIIIALTVGVIIGIYNSFNKNKYIGLVISKTYILTMKFMQNFFIPLLPLFVGGLFLKLFFEKHLNDFVATNIFVFLKCLLILMVYYIFWLCIAAKFKIRKAMEIIKNIFPAIITAFATVSSAAALPLSLEASNKNINNKKHVNVVMPLTLSFHLIGDTLIVPTMCMIVLLAFNHALPTIYDYWLFSCFFIINQFAGAGIPNATIMILVPVLIQYLGYTDEMIAFVIAFYALIEPISTVGNVIANNIFVIVTNNIGKLARTQENF